MDTQEEQNQSRQAATCGCLSAPQHFLISEIFLGMDNDYAEVSLLTCSACGRQWLRYFYELEALTASGRWYLGAIKEEQALHLTVENAKEILECLRWYFYGGSYYGGQIGRTSGRLYRI